ncbi:hypothetical protein MAR_026422 [Mya arenaria]|uniref:Uncharacterized protein n=1 Tax=Mya arenaria TaxID=6604 RepID=A0ABY7ESU9_MYAAR|nr:hypothetical protein MAR_026422 [Mya arenaria]
MEVSKMAASWGKAATSRIDRSQFENDELLQQLGTQFDVKFTDYDKWTRKTKLRPSVKEAEKERAKRAASAESCRHGQLTYREKKEQAKNQEEEKERSERIKILQGGISTLNSHFNREYARAKQALADTEAKLQERMKVIEREVADLDGRLKVKQEELHVLLNYKEDQEELEHITRTELSKYERERQSVQNTITKQVTEGAIQMMHPSLKDMALQNMVMKKEIELHKKQQEEIQKQNAELEKYVHDLLRDPKTNLRQQMFPEFFLYQEKCTPDMEVVLDIPRQQWLPI